MHDTYLWAHVLFSSNDIFLENIFISRDELHGQTEVDELQFPGHQEIVAGLDVRVNDIDVVNVSKHQFFILDTSNGKQDPSFMKHKYST